MEINKGFVLRQRKLNHLLEQEDGFSKASKAHLLCFYAVCSNRKCESKENGLISIFSYIL